MRVLVIAPHPDDEVLGCGGTIAYHSHNGDDVHIAIITKGSADLFPAEQVEQTRHEMQAAHTILGVNKTHLLDFPAPKLDTIPEHILADALRNLIYQIEPELLYIPHRGDIHADHRATYYAALVAARPINSCSIRRILCYETLSETEWAPPLSSEAFVPTVFVDVSALISSKLQAMTCFKGQLREPPHPRSIKAIEALAHIRGSTAGLPAAEAFMLVREVIRYPHNCGSATI